MRIKEIIAGGIHPVTAAAINGSVGTLVMAGSTAATAAVITTSMTLLTTASAAGAALPASDAGDHYLIKNEAGATCTLYPSATAGTVTINGTTSLSVADAKSVVVFFSSPTKCHSVPTIAS